MTDAQTDRMLEAHKFSPEGSIWAPESLQQVRGRLEFIDAHECDCGETPHESALHDLAHDDVPVLLKVIERQATEVERLRSYKSLPPGMVWQDYYSPDDVCKIRAEYEAEIEQLKARETAVADASYRTGQLDAEDPR
ncbi:hypothetical protein HGK72_26825 [Mycolicibacterium fortuitum]|uniref:hypothetical protein n=1 Tax=Mycolicibacterium fortuitum TaxID=1766 RepID=UPI0014903D59|nr:hypothetical protein [Mycolicibacterium fortuitum]